MKHQFAKAATMFLTILGVVLISQFLFSEKVSFADIMILCYLIGLTSEFKELKDYEN